MGEVGLPKIPFYFVRHGQTDWNAEGRLQGRFDIELNAIGVQQAQEAAEKLVSLGICRAVGSPLVRAAKTMDIVAGRLQIPVYLNAEMVERGFGAFDGMLIQEIEQIHHVTLDTINTDGYDSPGAEAWGDLKQRSLRSLSGWLEEEAPTVFVGHGAFFKALVEALTGQNLRSKNAVPYYFVPQDDGWTVEEVV